MKRAVSGSTESAKRRFDWKGQERGEKAPTVLNLSSDRGKGISWLTRRATLSNLNNEFGQEQ
jgi:hypothetical protein